MTFIQHIQSRIAHRARKRALMAEMSAMTDSELDDFNLSRARLAEIACVEARRA